MKDLIIPASNNNEWTDMDIEYFLIERSPEIIKSYEVLLEAAKAAYAAAPNSGMYHVSFWTGFDTLINSLGEIITEEGKKEFRELTDKEKEEYINMDDRLEANSIRIDESGNMKWVAWGKHCGTEFWTDSVSLEDLQRGSFEKVEAQPA